MENDRDVVQKTQTVQYAIALGKKLPKGFP